jgi:hypothetical protein
MEGYHQRRALFRSTLRAPPVTQPTQPTQNGARARARAALRRHAATLLAIVLVGVVWLALVTWLGFR